MKKCLKLIPIILLGFYLFIPFDAFASPGPEPNFHLICDSQPPIPFHIWQAGHIESSLDVCPDYSPQLAEIKTLILNDEVIESVIAPDSAEARNIITTQFPQTDCQTLHFHPIDEIVVATFTRPTYCVPRLAFGCVNPQHIVSPYLKIFHDFGELNVLPMIAMIATVVLGGAVGKWFPFIPHSENSMQPLTGRRIVKTILKLLGFLILFSIIFIVCVIFMPTIANWIRYPSVPEYIIRAGIITAVLMAWAKRNQQNKK